VAGIWRAAPSTGGTHRSSGAPPVGRSPPEVDESGILGEDGGAPPSPHGAPGRGRRRCSLLRLTLFHIHAVPARRTAEQGNDPLPDIILGLADPHWHCPPQPYR